MGKLNTIVDPKELLKELENLHPTDIAKSLKKIKKQDSDLFYSTLEKIPDDLLGEVLIELPENIREETYKKLSIEQLTDAVEELETDDATDVIQEIEEFDEKKASDILDGLEEDDQQDINWLKRYEEEEAGAFMQTELFSANISENIGKSIERLKVLKVNDEVENIQKVFLVDDDQTLLAALALEDLIIVDFDKTYKELIDELNETEYEPFAVQADEEIDDVVKKFEQYDLTVVAVTGYKGRLIGRITSDDIIDVIEQNATEQMYQLAGINDDYEHEDNLLETGKKRGLWLGVNLFTAVLASIVIGLFDETIRQYVALAILMPIVASMGGNAGTQTLAVMVRQIALGEIDFENSRYAVKKEVFVSLFNGFVFAAVTGVIASLWFSTWILGVVIGLSMVINLFAAGFFGAMIPIMLKKLDVDPAVGSTVILTTVTDIVGFFSFLALAKVMLVG